MTTIFDRDEPPADELLSRLVRHELQKHGNGKNGFWKNFSIVVAIASAAFTAGSNWHRIDALAEKVDTHIVQNKSEHETYATKETVEEHFRSLQRQLDDVKALILQEGRRR